MFLVEFVHRDNYLACMDIGVAYMNATMNDEAYIKLNQGNLGRFYREVVNVPQEAKQ